MAQDDFNVQPAQIESPLGAYGKMMQIKQAQQGYQVGQVELKQKQQELADDQTFRASMQDPALRGKTIGEVADTLAASGSLSPQGWAKYKQLDITQRKDTAALTTTELDNRAKAHAATQELYNNVMNTPVAPDQPLPNWPQVAQQYNSIPGNQKMPLDPNQPQTKQQLQRFAPLLDMNNAYLSSELAKRKAEADAKKAPLMEAGGAIYDTSGAKPNLVGGQPPVAQVQMQDWLKKNPGKGPSDYEVAMKKVVPAFNFNLQNSLGPSTGPGGGPSADILAVANGKLKLQDIIPMRAPLSVRRGILQQVMAVNPDYKSSDYDVEKGVAKAFTSGKPAEELVAFNTAIAHADLLQKAADALNNGDIRAANKLGNAIGVQFGSDKATNFGVIKNAYTREVTKALSAGHLTDAEISQQGGTIPADASPAQITGALSAYRSLMASKVQQRQAQFQSGMQAKPNFGGPTLTNQNQGGGQRPPLTSFEK